MSFKVIKKIKKEVDDLKQLKIDLSNFLSQIKDIDSHKQYIEQYEDFIKRYNMIKESADKINKFILDNKIEDKYVKKKRFTERDRNLMLHLNSGLHNLNFYIGEIDEQLIRIKTLIEKLLHE